MKYLLIIFFFLFKLPCSFSQKADLGIYYKCINKAELFITQNNLDSSSYYYRLGFSNLKFPFARNLYNAAVVEAKLKNHKFTVKYLTLLIKLGASINKFKTDTIFTNFLLSESGKYFIINARKIKPVYDLTYRQELLKMVIADQSYRVKPNAYSVYGDTIKKIDKANIDNFLKLIEKKGFPSEYLVGIDSNGLTLPLYSVLVIHQSSGYLQQYNFSTILKKYILLGDIENKAGNYMINRSEGYNFFELMKLKLVKIIDSSLNHSNPTNNLILKESEWGYFPLDAKELLSINSKRQLLFLDTYQDNLQKLLFGIKHKEYLLSGFGSTTTLSYTDESGFENDKSKMNY